MSFCREATKKTCEKELSAFVPSWQNKQMMLAGDHR